MLGRAPRLPTWRYGRRLLWRAYDEWGVVEVVEGFLGRALHFGTASIQGRINRDYPWLPVAEYAKTMSIAAAFPSPISRTAQESIQAPRVPQVCLLGLGTGSLAWSYHHLLPHAELTVIELRATVIEAAKQYFRLDDLAQRTHLTILEGDALEQLGHLARGSQTLVAIDLFTASDMADCLNETQFWREVARVLHPRGVLCVNTWSSRPQACRFIHQMIEAHICPAGELYTLDHSGFSNLILFASPRPIELKSVLKRTEQIDEKLAWPEQKTARLQRKWKLEADHVGLSRETISARAHRLCKQPV